MLICLGALQSAISNRTSAVSLSCFSLLRDRTISLMDFHPLAAGADDRFDKLTVSILIPAIDQLGQHLCPIRALVVGAIEIQRSERVVRRTNHEQTSETAIELFERI